MAAALVALAGTAAIAEPGDWHVADQDVQPYDLVFMGNVGERASHHVAAAYQFAQDLNDTQWQAFVIEGTTGSCLCGSEDPFIQSQADRQVASYDRTDKNFDYFAILSSVEEPTFGGSRARTFYTGWTIAVPHGGTSDYAAITDVEAFWNDFKVDFGLGDIIAEKEAGEARGGWGNLGLKF